MFLAIHKFRSQNNSKPQIKPEKKGFTLIEVMVGLVIISIAISLSGKLIAGGLEAPFVLERAEPWLEFMEDASQAIQNLPDDSPLLEDGEHLNPFPQLSSALGAKDFKLEWQNCKFSKNYSPENEARLICGINSPSNSSLKIKAAFISATTRLNKTISWRVYKKLSSELPD